MFWLGRLSLAVLLVVVMTWPTAARFDRAGRLTFGDGEFSIWNVSWVAHALTTTPSRLFDANIFHPDRDTLAFSEANIAAGAMGVPFHLAWRGNPYATHNGAKLTAFTLTFVFTWVLAAHLGASAPLACFAAIAFAFCPQVFARTAHIQLMSTFGLPLSLWLFHRITDRPTPGRGVALGAALWLQGLACGYYGIFAGLSVGLGTLFYAWSRGLWRRAAYWVSVAAGVFVSVALTVPFLAPFLRVRAESGFERTLEDASMFSADWQAWLASSARAHRWMWPWIVQWNDALFPGFVVTLLGVGGIVFARRLPAGGPFLPGAGRALDTRPREVIGFYGLVAALAFWASFGPSAGLYAWLHEAVPVFSFIRAPSRFGILVPLALAVIAVAVLHRTSLRLPRRWATWLGVAACVAALADTFTAPLGLQPASTPARAHLHLRVLPRGAVIELPFWHARGDFPRHARYLLYSTYHWQPLVNGYSDHIPAWFRQQAETLSGFPSLASFGALRPRDARYALFHLRMYDAAQREALLTRLEEFGRYLRRLDTDDEVWLFEITGYPDAAAP